MKKLICTVGLPRSGKSTWCKTQSYPIVNKDSIRLALHGQRYLQDAEKEIRAMIIRGVMWIDENFTGWKKHALQIGR